MTSATSMSSFCNWLLPDSVNRLSPCAIALHSAKSNIIDKQINDIADYLNEYDDGHWLNATDELIANAASDPCNRGLLGLNEIDTDATTDGPEQFIRCLTTLSTKGHMVFRWPDHPWAPPSPDRIFHAGIGTPNTLNHRCHITIDPDLIPTSSINHIIGDVFLEWMTCKKTVIKATQRL